MTAIENAKTTKADSDSPPPTIDDDSQQLARAHVRFTQSVTKGILTLQRQCGYSRERATTTLLRELSKQSDGTGSEAPTDDEIFRAMNLYGMGMEDAAHALTVSRAVGRLISERGLSAAQAIDDLASKLSIARLLESSEASSSEDERPASPRNSGGMKRPLSLESTTTTTTNSSSTPRISSPTNNNNLGDNSSRVEAVASKVSASKKTHVKSSAHKKLKTTSSHASRKRPAPDAENKNGVTTRARADSVSEEVQAKVAKKARREDGTSSPVANNNSPGDWANKRSARRSSSSSELAESPNPAEV